MKIRVILSFCAFLLVLNYAGAQPKGKKISPDLFGLFFEDINYSADGGLYAEMVQNRSFEYIPTERHDWNPFSYWEYVAPGFSLGNVGVETNAPLNNNNTHYVILTSEHVGKEAQYTGISGVGLKNTGFNGMVVKSGDKYNFSMFARQISSEPMSFHLSLKSRKGKVLAETTFSTSSNEWKKYTASLSATESNDTANLVILATTKGKIALDMISLFPEKTFKNRPNGMRSDLAQLLADIKPRFIRFPGGCLAHGDGLGNMYRWKNSIGNLEERKEQRNIWGYNQTLGLGYFEYFQFCEDVGAKPLPVLPAGVSCQNSGGTWQIGGTGQKCLPMNEMQDYIQEVLDLIEWANGATTSTWGAKRAAAGHPAPFNLEYIGIGNEDKITPEFEERFKMIFSAVKAKYPKIKVIGTAGPFHSGEDFEKGWKVAKDLKVDIVDEHYYVQPEWFMENQQRYDKYNRAESQVYLGEYASWGNKLRNALAEAAYMVGLERNGDIVRMASYAPLLAKKDFTQWKTDMIFFDNVKIVPTPNYYVQKMFSANQGDFYFENIFAESSTKWSTVAASCVQENKTGDIILKIVNAGANAKSVKINLSSLKKINPSAEMEILTGSPEVENSFENPANIIPIKKNIQVKKQFDYEAPAMSLTVIRITTK